MSYQDPPPEAAPGAPTIATGYSNQPPAYAPTTTPPPAGNYYQTDGFVTITTTTTTTERFGRDDDGWSRHANKEQ